MKLLIKAILTLIIFSNLNPTIAQEDDPIKKLDWLIGEWTFEDKAITGNYRETGIRTCNYTLNNKYILCESKGTDQKGSSRVYQFLFNYNTIDKRFEVVSLNETYPRKTLYVATLSDDNFEINLNYQSWTNEGLIGDYSATIKYNGKDQYIWSIREEDPNPSTGKYEIAFTDKVTRTHATNP